METKFNFKSQLATSIEQSKRLLALGLKKETADMFHGAIHNGAKVVGYRVAIGYNYKHFEVFPDDIPAWSLHRLMLLIPKEVNIDGYRFPLRFDALIHLDEADDVYEYLIGVLERTIKEGHFNKEYLEETL